MALPIILGQFRPSKLSHFRNLEKFLRCVHRNYQTSSAWNTSSKMGAPLRFGLTKNIIPPQQFCQLRHSCVRTLMTERPCLKNKTDKLFVVFGRQVRNVSNRRAAGQERAKSILIYISATAIFMLGMSYAGVPLYRMFCQATGMGGQATIGHDTSMVETMIPVEDRLIKVIFNADVASSMRWNFRPQQSEVKVIPGETALAFYKAKNPTDKPIVGISTYNVLPSEAGQYFNKIQCFCFEEQLLNPNEEVDMPVFFFIDPEYAEDPKLQTTDTIILSYTFFEAKEGLKLPVPSYVTT